MVLKSQSLTNYNFDQPKYSIELKKELKEISGLTLDSEQKLFAHNDENGTIFQLNLSDGKIIKEFYLGNKKNKDDFEDIAYANGKFYLLNSKGELFLFSEGENKEDVEFKKIETGLKTKYDTEGLCYDASINSLLITSKESEKKNNSKYVFRFNITTMKLDKEPFITIDAKGIKKGNPKEEFKPTAIIKNEKTNSYFILGGKRLCIIEINREGKIIGEIELSKKFHNQPEGMVMQKNGNLFISDEAVKKHAKLTSYILQTGN